MSNNLLQELREAILDYDPDQSAALTTQALESGLDAKTVMDCCIDAIRSVGDDFGRGELFLPDLVGAADALQAATPIIMNAYKMSGHARESAGTVVLGTVAGDIHTIGKSMVSSLLTAEGFEVHDIGIDVGAAKFIEAIEEHSPHIVAMSALLTTTAPMAKDVIEQLQASGLRDDVRVMVGGGAITAEFAESIGADGYDPTAPGAVEVAKELVANLAV